MKPNCNIFILKKDYCYYFTPSLRERSFMTSTATWGPGGQAKSD